MLNLVVLKIIKIKTILFPTTGIYKSRQFNYILKIKKVIRTRRWLPKVYIFSGTPYTLCFSGLTTMMVTSISGMTTRQSRRLPKRKTKDLAFFLRSCLHNDWSRTTLVGVLPCYLFSYSSLLLPCITLLESASPQFQMVVYNLNQHPCTQMYPWPPVKYTCKSCLFGYKLAVL